MMGPRSLLLVEGNNADVGLIRKVLQELDDELTITVEPDGFQAWNHLQSLEHHEVPDLVILDINLPKLRVRAVDARTQR